jgi:hypothetical protein
LFQVDSFSLFNNEYPSADSTVSGIVTLLAAAKALYKVKDQIALNATAKDILFAFFQGVSMAVEL